MKKPVYTQVPGGSRIRIGNAEKQPDGTITVWLDAVPVDGVLIIDDAKKRRRR
jgi:hypothetical protein